MKKPANIFKDLLVLFPFLLVFMGTALPLSAAIEVDSSFEPSVIRQGDASIYRINVKIEGRGGLNLDNTPRPDPPDVEGLRTQFLGLRNEVQIINGRTTKRYSYLYRVQATRSGEFEMPAFSIRLDGREYTIAAASLEVVASGERVGEEGVGSHRPVTLELDLPREKLFVGESVPATIRLLLDNEEVLDASLGAEHPEKVGDAFSVGQYGDLSQTRSQRNGRIYTTAEWDTLITPLKTGSEPLLFELPVNVALRESRSRQRRDPFDSFFGPSPFSRMFNREQIRVYSEDREIEIRPLPTADRPTDFTGGIGRFFLKFSNLSNRETQVGEPVLLTIAVEGEGNFDRLNSPVIEDVEGWRSYDPEQSFAATDTLRYRGVKTFTHTLIPRSEDITATPPVSFSYFDPENETYKTIEIPPMSLEVKPSPVGTRPPVDERRANPVESRRGPDLLPLESDPTPWISSPQPTLTSGAFWLWQIPVAAVFTLVFLRLRHANRLRKDPDYAKRNRARKAAKLKLAQARTASEQGDGEAFLRAACGGIQESVGPFLNASPESLTETDISRLLEARAVDPGLREEVFRFFHTAEQVRYGARPPATSDLPGEYARLEKIIAAILGSKVSPSRSSTAPVGSLSLLILATAAFLLPETMDARTIENEVDAREVFQQAVASYEDGDFQTASEQFTSLLPDYESAPLRYNLGNTYYRTEDYPMAVYQYERAAFLDSRNPDIPANLNLAREAAEIQAPEASWLSSIGNLLPSTAWLWLLTLGFWGMLAAVVLCPLLEIRALWHRFLIGGFLVLFTLSVLGAIAWQQRAGQAIIVQANTALRYAPTATSPAEKRFIGGETVVPTQTHHSYVKVTDPITGGSGWVLTSSLKRIGE